jgi:hypothetical protein
VRAGAGFAPLSGSSRDLYGSRGCDSVGGTGHPAAAVEEPIEDLVDRENAMDIVGAYLGGRSERRAA